MIKLNANSKIILNNKTEIPVIGFGVFRIPDGEEVVNAVKWALEAGYRHIDTAMIYKNEEGYFLANLDYCKGCGICSRECWTGCIKMVEEEK